MMRTPGFSWQSCGCRGRRQVPSVGGWLEIVVDGGVGGGGRAGGGVEGCARCLVHGQGVDGGVCGMLGGRVVMWKCGVAGWDGGRGGIECGDILLDCYAVQVPHRLSSP